MTSKSLLVLASLALAAAASAQVGVDGLKGTEWDGVSAAHVTHDAGAPTSNFSTPTSTTQGADYDIFVRGDSTYLYGLIMITGNAGLSAGNFANLYFDLDPQNNNGSDWGLEINGNTNTASAFVAGGPSGFAMSASDITIDSVSGGIEFALKWSYLEDGSNPDITYYPGTGPVAPGGKVVMRLSQSFGYSVAGGATYGTNRLGSAFAPRAASAVPGPSALVAFGLGVLGRKRRRAAK